MQINDKSYLERRARAAKGRHVATNAKRINFDMYNIHTPTHGAGKAGERERAPFVWRGGRCRLNVWTFGIASNTARRRPKA